MRLSKQLYVTELAEGWWGIYAPFNHKVAFLFDEALDRLRRGELHLVSESILQYLIESNILVEEGFEERWRQEMSRAPQLKLNSMFLVVTQDCNFGCSYCAVMGNLDASWRRSETMSIGVGRRAVEMFERQLCKSQPPDARVTFYGGEPMLNKGLLADLAPRIRAITYPNQTHPVEIVMISNGYLYDPDLTALFKQHGVGVCISLDGAERHQNVTRVLHQTKKPTFDRVIENYRRYQDAGLSMGISTALGKHNTFDLVEICHFYANELRPPFVEFQIPYQVARESNTLWLSTAEVAHRLMEAYTVLRSYGIIEGTTYRRLRDFALGQIHFRDCGASGCQIVVAPDGAVGPCHSLVGSRAFFDGSVLDPECDPSRMPNFEEWARRYPLNMPVCFDCPFISLCGGGCIYNSFVSTGAIWDKDPQACDYMREMVEWILRDLWVDTGMAAKHGMKPRASDGSLQG